MTGFNYINSKYQGNAGHGAAIAYYSRLGYIVSNPITDSARYDILVDNHETILKVQCKTTDYKAPSGEHVVGLTTQGGNQSYHTSAPFDNKEVDLLFVLTSDDRWYSIPSPEVTTTTALTLSAKWDKYLVHTPQDFQFTEQQIESRVKYRELARRKDAQNNCEDCGKAIHVDSNRCRSCAQKYSRVKNRVTKYKIDWPTTQELLEGLLTKPFTVLGKELGVSDNAVRKRLESQGVDVSRISGYSRGKEEYINQLLDKLNT